ncbi:60S ribosomal protein L10 [Linum perenne]
MLRRLFIVPSSSFPKGKRSSSAGSATISCLKLVVIVMDDCHNAIHTFSYRLNTIVLHRGFTKFNRADHVKLKQENGIMPDGVNSKLLGCHGPLTNHQSGRVFAAVART